MTSRSWINDFEDRRRFAQKLREEENWTSDEEEDESEKTEIPEKWTPQSYIPTKRRTSRKARAAKKLREEEWLWSSSLPKGSYSYLSGFVRHPCAAAYEIPSDVGDQDTDGKLREEEKWSVDHDIPPSVQGSQRSSRTFSKCEIQEATNNLSDSLKIGEGGYGSVYKGHIDNTEVAIKILSNTSDQDMTGFHREVGALNGLRHENLVNLIGSCSEVGALVYEYIPNGSLEDCLVERSAELTWRIRTRIVLEICGALMYLHANHPDPLVHGDLKPHNVLLGVNFKTKLADFGLCRFLTQGENSGKFHQTKVCFGTLGYIDPDFLESGIVRPAIDIYSFGKTIIRILTNKRPAEISRKVHEARKTKSLMTIVDPAVRGWPEQIVELLACFALRCCKYHRYEREFMRKFCADLGILMSGATATGPSNTEGPYFWKFSVYNE